MRSIHLQGRTRVMQVSQVVTESRVAFSIELCGSFFISTDGTAEDPFASSDAAASKLLLEAIAQKGGRGADGKTPPPCHPNGDFQAMGTEVTPRVELMLHDATYIHECQFDSSMLGVTSSSMAIIDGAYQRVGGENQERWPAIVPEGLQAYQMLSEDVVRERGWINPRFPERATEVEEQN